MQTQTITLNVSPDGVPPIVNVSQNDNGRVIRMALMDSNVEYSLNNSYTYTICGTKPTGTGFSYNNIVTRISGTNVLTFTTTPQMTVVAGQVRCGLIIYNGNTHIETLNFIMNVQRSGLEASTIIDSDDFDSIIKDAVIEYLEESGIVIDDTLTVQGAAAESKITGDNIRELNSALNSTNEALDGVAFKSEAHDSSLWELGAIGTSDGTLNSSTTRVRTKGYIDAATIKEIKTINGFVFVLYAFNQNDVYIGALTLQNTFEKVSGSDAKKSTQAYLNNDTYKYKIMLIDQVNPSASVEVSVAQNALLLKNELAELAEEVDFLDEIRNDVALFDNGPVISNHYFDSSGHKKVEANWNVTKHIQINSKGKYYYIGITTVGNAPRYCYFGEDNDFISAHPLKSGKSILEVPENAYYVVFSVHNSDLSTFKLYEANACPDEDSFYSKTALTSDKWVNKGISSGTGNYGSDSTIRLSSELLKTPDFKSIEVRSGFEFAVYAYDKSGTYKGVLVKENYFEVDPSIETIEFQGSYTFVDVNRNYRVMVRKTDNTTITPADASAITFEQIDVFGSDLTDESLYLTRKKNEIDIEKMQRTSAEGYGQCAFKALLVGDPHKESTRFARATELVKSWGESYFDAMINVGDTVQLINSEDLSWHNNAIANLPVPYLNVVGNHDAWSSLGVLGAKTDAYDAIIAPIATQAGIVQPSNASSLGLNYYYIDFDNVRVIALDCIYWDADEASWLETVLADALNNELSVICLSHYGFLPQYKTHIKSLWREIDTPTVDGTNIVAGEKVQAFINNGGTFLCWLVGHLHADNIHVLSNYGNQLVITLPSLTNRAGNLFKNDAIDSYNYNCLTYFSVDTWWKTIRLVRIGADIDTWGVRHEGVSLNYETGELIASW